MSPPECPFSPDDWLADGLPVCTEYTAWAVPCAPATSLALLTPLWCPVPQLGPQPTTSILEWSGGPVSASDKDQAGAATSQRVLELRT
jgi:hypothetical protein